MSWTTANFLDVVKDVSGGNVKTPQSEFIKTGKIPVIDQGKDFIAGFTNNQDAQFKSSDLPVVIFGDHTKSIKYVDFPFAMGADGVKVLSVKDGLDSKFFYHYLLQVKIPDAGYSRHYKFLKELKIPLPPLEEQRRIAAILDKAEALRAKRREAIAKLDQLLQSVFLEMFGDPIQNNKGWDTTSLQSIGMWQSGGTPERSNPLYFQGEIPWFSSGELNELYVFDSKEHITHEAIGKSSAKIINPGSIMLGMYDTAAFKSSITTRECSCNQAIAFSKIDESKADSLYVYYVLQLGKDFYVSQQRGVRQKNLNLTMIKETRIPKPPLILQNKFSRIAKKIHTKKKIIEDQELKIDFFIKSLEHKFFQ